MKNSKLYRQLEAHLDHIQAGGRYYFTPEEIKTNLSLTTESFHIQLKPLLRKKNVALIRNGFYVIVTPEYRTIGAPPLTYYIEGLMKITDKPYYIGLLNAAAWYGAAHQQPQNYSIITSAPALPAINKPYAQVKFISKTQWNGVDIVQQKTNAGYVNVSSPELTALDLCHYTRHAGGINQVATVLQELAEEILPEKLIQVAEGYASIMAVQRLGYIMELLGEDSIAGILKGWLKSKKHHATLLDTGNKRHYSKVTGNDWRIIVNTEIETDL